MTRIRPSITSRELNQNSSKVLAVARDEEDIVPITYGREGKVAAYLVPANVLFDSKSIREAREAELVPLVELLGPMELKGNPSQTLESMREEDAQ